MGRVVKIGMDWKIGYESPNCSMYPNSLSKALVPYGASGQNRQRMENWLWVNVANFPRPLTDYQGADQQWSVSQSM